MVQISALLMGNFIVILAFGGKPSCMNIECHLARHEVSDLNTIQIILG